MKKKTTSLTLMKKIASFLFLLKLLFFVIKPLKDIYFLVFNMQRV